jgi:hypothetical protein
VRPQKSFRRRFVDTHREMDALTSSIVAYKQGELASKVQFAVARKILDNQEYQGNAAIKLIQAAGDTANKSGDALVAAATGLGGSLDTYA